MKRIDPHLSFAKFFDDKAVFIAAYHMSKNLSDGHICLDIDRFNTALESLEIDEEQQYLFTPIDRDLLKNSPFVTDTLMSSIFNRPFVLDGNRIYLQRYWIYESKILDIITQKMDNSLDLREASFTKLKSCTQFIADQFTSHLKGETEWQLVAAINSALNNFSIITGGPGTGKTFTVAKLLSIILQLNIDESIVMVAPTGKAAARMGESLQKAVNDSSYGIKASAAIIDKLNTIESKTIHSLLGYRKGTHKFKHNVENKLQQSVIIADEASMIDVSMMSKLLDATKDTTKVILLGDKDQLASVEAGSIFGDLCRVCGDDIRDITDEVSTIYQQVTQDILESGSDKNHALFGSVCELKVSRRFKDDEGIGKFSKAIISGNEAIVDDEAFFESTNDVVVTDDEKEVTKLFSSYRKYIKEDDTEKAIELFDTFRVLCATREGEFGVNEVNAKIEKMLKLNGKKDTFYHNQPIMIKKNDRQLEIYNGDTGIVRKNGNGKLFLHMKGRENPIPVALIANCETAFAMTIHKSQGSDYNTVAVLMPEEESRILSKELLYTAVTRAKEKVIVFGKKEILKSAINHGVDRVSGVVERLSKEK